MIETNTFEYNFLLVLSVFLIVGKCILALYLLKKVLEYKKSQGFFVIDFVFGFFFMLLTLIISRIFYIYFDFFLTRFDYDKYHLIPNQYIWKAASITFLSGIAFFLFIIEKKALKFKFKGIFSYIIVAIIIFELLYPINAPEDFELIVVVETIGCLIGFILFPTIFLYMGIKTPKIRKIAFLFAFGIIIFVVGAVIQARFILIPLIILYGPIMKIIIWIIAITLKLIGLAMITYSCTKFY